MEWPEHLLLLILGVLAAGVAVGRLWARLAPNQSAAAGRNRVSESIHYVLGLDFLATQQIDRAIAELTRAVKTDTEAVEIYLILGNLFREKGQLERAIQIHQSILHRPKLTNREKAHALLCLGVDFKRSGFRERASSTFEEVLKLDGKNGYALWHLEKIREEERDWPAALALQERLSSLAGMDDPKLAACLHVELGRAAWARPDLAAAARSFETAIRLDRRLPQAHLHLSDLLEEQGRFREALEQNESLVRECPERAYLSFERIERLYQRLGETHKVVALYRSLASADLQDWRAHLALGRLLANQGKAEEAFEALLTASERNPHHLEVHLTLWELLVRGNLPGHLIERYLERTRSAVFFRDPHVCIKCRYRSSGILWRCPHCQEWNTFIEERISARGQS